MDTHSYISDLKKVRVSHTFFSSIKKFLRKDILCGLYWSNDKTSVLHVET